MKLPPKRMRYCGVDFHDDEYFVSSGISEANRLAKHFGLDKSTTLLDVGCGAGRLPLGIIASDLDIEEYVGVDVLSNSIKWCREFIATQDSRFRFVHLDVRNVRYHPSGQKLHDEYKFPFSRSYLEAIYLYSVFSHMTIADIDIYLSEFWSILASSGYVFTGFEEEGFRK